MILSRTARSLYWIGRYVERAEFTANLVEATVRLDALAARPAGEAAWRSALRVATSAQAYSAAGGRDCPTEVSSHLLLSPDNPSSAFSSIDKARSNARSVRGVINGESWLSVNQAWMQMRDRAPLDGTDSILSLADEIKAGTRAFEGALHRMLRNEARYFIELGVAVERANGTARLLDVKYHLLLPQGERVGGPIDRDQWTSILRTVSALAAYRWLYGEGLKPWLVAELLVVQHEFPRSLRASLELAADSLTLISQRTNRPGRADHVARMMVAGLRRTTGSRLIQQGLHEYLLRFGQELAGLDKAIADQFRFA